MIDTAVTPAPAPGLLGRPPLAGLSAGLVVGGAALLFLLARSVVWARPVSLEDVDLLALGALPALFHSLAWSVLRPAYRVGGVLAWGWVISLAAYLALHVAHSFEDIEGPVRAALQPGVGRYVAYGFIYSAVGVAAAGLARGAWSTAGLSARFAGAVAVGSALNALYFGVALFMLRL